MNSIETFGKTLGDFVNTFFSGLSSVSPILGMAVIIIGGGLGLVALLWQISKVRAKSDNKQSEVVATIALDATTQLSARTNLVLTQQQQINELERKLDSFVAEDKIYKLKQAEKDKEAEEARKVLQSSLDEANKKLDDAKKAQVETDRKIEQLQEKLQTSETEKQELLESNSLLKDQLTEVVTQNNDLKKQLADLLKQNEELKEQIIVLQHQVADLQTQLNQHLKVPTETEIIIQGVFQHEDNSTPSPDL